MAYEQREGDGSLFRNSPERMAGKSENYPPYSGTILIDGKEYWLDGWLKDGKNGKFFSLRAKLKEQRQGSTQQESAREETKPDDDKIPF